MTTQAASATTITPKGMEGYIRNSLHVLDATRNVPASMFQNCAGLVLISAKERGLLVSSQSGAGVAVARHGDKWSAPLAVSLGSFGIGAVIGRANQDVLILLNPLSMQRFLEGQGQIKVGADFGFTAGKLGRGSGADLMASDQGGLATSVVYTFSSGALVSAQIEMGAMVAVQHVNEAAYHKSTPKDILRGDEDILPKGLVGELVAELHDKLMDLATSRETATNYATAL